MTKRGRCARSLALPLALALALGACAREDDARDGEAARGATADPAAMGEGRGVRAAGLARESGEALAPPALIDANYPVASAGDPGWEYAFSAEVDLDGDGAAERAVLVANVSLHRGEPAWDDGQVWQAYVLEPDGTRTTIYSQYVQIGEVVAAISLSPPDGRPAVLLTERTGAGVRVFEIGYGGPGRVDARRLLARETPGQFERLRSS